MGKVPPAEGTGRLLPQEEHPGPGTAVLGDPSAQLLLVCAQPSSGKQRSSDTPTVVSAATEAIS